MTGRPPTANRTRKVRDAITRGTLDGRSSTARKVRRFRTEMKADLAYDGWGRMQDLDLRLAADFYGRLVRAEEYLESHPLNPEKSQTVHAEHSTAAAGLTEALERIKTAREKALEPRRREILQAIQEKPVDARTAPGEGQSPAVEAAVAALEAQKQPSREDHVPRNRRKHREDPPIPPAEGSSWSPRRESGSHTIEAPGYSVSRPRIGVLEVL
jgi:hypothetical protein